jgi:phosphomethylpyrimidine synthase
VRDGIIASKIAAHAADIAKGVPGAIEKDRLMAKYRKELNWDGQIALSFNPELVKKWRAELPPQVDEVCSMCGEFCAIKAVERALARVEETASK